MTGMVANHFKMFNPIKSMLVFIIQTCLITSCIESRVLSTTLVDAKRLIANQSEHHQGQPEKSSTKIITKRAVDFGNIFDGFEGASSHRSPLVPNGGVRPESLSFDSFFDGLEDPPSVATESPAAVPQFMLDLFNRFDQDRSMQPTSNIIRSFPNKASTKQQVEFMSSLSSHCNIKFNARVCVNKKLLLFNISTIPMHEQITQAELRFYRVLKNFRWPGVGVDIKIEIVEVDCDNLKAEHWKKDSNTFCKADSFDMYRVNTRVLESRQLTVRRDDWETFDITGAMQSWTRRKTLHQLEIHITIMDTAYGIVDIDPDPISQKEPLLVVFSDDTSRNRRLERKDEVKMMLAHQVGVTKQKPISQYNEGHDEDFGFQRKKRSVMNGDIDIEIGGINIPVTLRDPDVISLHKDERQRVKRSSDHGPHCHRADMSVTFSDIGLDYIVQPARLDAYKCVGSCEIPLTGSPTPHATIQATAHFHFPNQHGGPCCVPTKLGPVSLLYYRDTGVVEYTYKYDGMQVLECGCR